MKRNYNFLQRENYYIKDGSIKTISRVWNIPYSVHENFRMRYIEDSEGTRIIIHLKPVSGDLAWSIVSREISKVIPELETSGNIISRELEKKKLERENLNILKEEITSGAAKLFAFNALIGFSDFPRKLTERKSNLKKHLSKIGIKTENKRYGDYRYLSRLETDVSFYIESKSLASILPINRGYLLDYNGVFIGIDSSTESPIFLNRYRLPSSHQLVLGMTGFGKSYLVKLMLYREKIVNDTDVIIIDPMGEYGKINNFTMGKDLDLINRGINIFKPMEFMSPKENTERVISLLSLIFNLSENDKGILDAELTRFFEGNMELNSLMEAINKRNKETFNKISPIFEGSLKMFSKGESEELSGSLRINLGEVPKQLLPFYMLLSLEFVMRQKSKRRRIVVIDESHYLLDERTIVTLERYVRHARHDNISMIMVSQSANDFFKSKFSVSILENCSIHILLRHQNVSEEIVDFYHLDENLKYFIKYSAGFDGKETWGYMQIPGFRAIVKIKSSADEHEKIEGIH